MAEPKRTFITFEHLKKFEDLPANPEIGRAYFVEDTGSIIVNHGEGNIEYGKSHDFQAQIDVLTEENEELARQIATLEADKNNLLEYLVWKTPGNDAQPEAPEEPTEPEAGNGN